MFLAQMGGTKLRACLWRQYFAVGYLRWPLAAEWFLDRVDTVVEREHIATDWRLDRVAEHAQEFGASHLLQLPPHR